MKTLVDLLRKDISRTDDLGPMWTEVVEDAVLRQDLEWVLDLVVRHDLRESAEDRPPQAG